jgi:Cu(I)/Ag(I) efflux system membrane fusion protein
MKESIMKKNNTTIIMILVLLAAGGWFFMNKHSMPAASLGDHNKDIYYCPMHPDYQSDRPGTCPICHMNLVKKEKVVKPASSEGEHSQHAVSLEDADVVAGYSAVTLDSRKQQLIGLKIAPVTRKALVKTLHAFGYVAHDLELYEMQLEYIEAWRIYYAFLSRRPVKDEFKTDWREYSTEDSTTERWNNVDKLKAQQRLIKAEYELRHMGLTNTQLQELRQVKYGQPWVLPDLLFFDENHSTWVYAQVLETDLGFITIGQKAIVTIPTYGETTEGIVRNVALAIDPDTRTTQVRIELPKYKGELNVNLFVNVEFPVELDETLVVPRESIMDTGLSKIVFVQTRNGVFEPHRIQTGFEGGGMVIVKSGLKEGDRVVVSGNFLLDSESRLQGALAGGHNHD